MHSPRVIKVGMMVEVRVGLVFRVVVGDVSFVICWVAKSIGGGYFVI